MRFKKGPYYVDWFESLLKPPYGSSNSYQIIAIYRGDIRYKSLIWPIWETATRQPIRVNQGTDRTTRLFKVACLFSVA